MEKRNEREKEKDERKKIKNEKRRLYRIKKREEARNLKKSMSSITHNTINSINTNHNNIININLFMQPPLPVIPNDIQIKINNEGRKLRNNLMNKLDDGNLDSFVKKKKNNNKEDSEDNNNDYGIQSSTRQNQNIINLLNNIDDKSGKGNSHNHHIIPTINLDGVTMNEFNQLINNVNSVLMGDSTTLLNGGTSGVAKGKTTKVQVKYPIEDEELYRNPSLYNLESEYLHKPVGKTTIIPNEYFTKIIKIWDFFNTFKSNINISEFTPEQLYLALNYYNEEDIELVTELHLSIIFVFIVELNTYDYSSLYDEDYLIMLKLATEDNFKKNVLKGCWPEVVRLIMSTSMYSLLLTDQLKEFKHRLTLVNRKSFNLFSLEEKVTLLSYLVDTAFSSSFIRNIISADITKKNELNKERNDILLELKSFESRKRELERQEKFTQPKTKIEQLNKRLETLVEDNLQLSRSEIVKLRKELSTEREQFASMIKEVEQIENTKAKINVRIDKINYDIYVIPSTNKKLVGIDGLRNEYYFFSSINSKLYTKKFKGESKGSRIYEWREYTTEEEISDLIDRLSEKGINEKELINKIKTINKKLTLKSDTLANKTEEDNDKMIIDEEEEMKEKSTTPEDISKSVLVWRNNSRLIKEKEASNNTDEYDELAELFIGLEEKITDYLYQDQKEWDAFDNREQWKSYIKYIKQIPELLKSIILFNERFKTPYKINDFKPKIIDDDYETARFTIYDESGSINPNKIDQERVIAAKVKLWSKDFTELGIDKIFLEYVNNVISFSGVYFAFYVFDGAINNLIKRRDIYKMYNKKTEGIAINDEEIILKSDSKKSITNNNNNIVMDDYYYDESLSAKGDYLTNNAGIRTRSRRNPTARNIIIDDDDDDDEEEEEEENNNIKTRNRSKRCIKNNNNKNNIIEDSDEEEAEDDYSSKEEVCTKTTRDRDRASRHQNRLSVNVKPEKNKKKNDEWSDLCYTCKEPGKLICCEGCQNVTHLFCAMLEKEPDVWYCEECSKQMEDNENKTQGQKSKKSKLKLLLNLY